mgnify:CR=1 FL=1
MRSTLEQIRTALASAYPITVLVSPEEERQERGDGREDGRRDGGEDLSRPEDRRLPRGKPLLHVTVDVLDDDDRVVDQHAEHEDQREERDRVDGHAGGVHEDERAEEAERDAQHGEKRVPEADEDEQRECDEDDAEAGVPLQDVEDVADVRRSIVPDLEAHVLGQPGLEVLHLVVGEECRLDPGQT